MTDFFKKHSASSFVEEEAEKGTVREGLSFLLGLSL